MYKEHLLESINRELILLKRLAHLVEERDLDFRPHEKLRSTKELMQYLSNIGAIMMRWFIKNDMSPELREQIKEQRSTLTIQNFPARIDEQWQTIQDYFKEIKEQDLFTKEVELPTKEKMILGMAIINAPIKWLASYRMELFIYLKMNGKSELTTKESWTFNA